jgi:RNA polymerase sigma factor (sigma-70 family)
MVFGVCRRVVRNYQDAEDAFQATFLVLARKATSVRPRERVANWLHGVALRTAMKAKSITAKQRSREKLVTELPEPELPQQARWRDLQPVLDHELNALPENYRLPILLCDLEGKTIREATRQLGWQQGTLAGRLARGRKLLAKRLANRGVGLSAGVLAAVVSQNAASAAVPMSLISSTVKASVMLAAGQAAVAGVVPAKVAALTGGVLKAMLLSKLKLPTVGLVLVVLLSGAAGAIYCAQAAEPPQKAEQRSKATGTDTGDYVWTWPGTTNRDELDGVWAVVSVVDDGKNKLAFDPIFSYAAGTQAPVRNARLTLRKGEFTLKTGIVSLNGLCVFDSSKTPKKMYLNVNPDGDGALLSLQGVYTFDGDNLTITLSGVPASIPAGLAGKQPGVCYTLRREPPPKVEPKNRTRTDASTPQVWPSPPRADEQWGENSNDPDAPRIVLAVNVSRDEKLVILEERLTNRENAARPTLYIRYSQFSLKDGRAYTADGRPIPEDELWRRLPASTAQNAATVLIGTDDYALGPHYRRALKQDTIILIGKAVLRGFFAAENKP